MDEIRQLRCDLCGLFVSLADLDSGEATHRFVVPDSEYTFEEFETTCKNCTKRRNDGKLNYTRILHYSGTRTSTNEPN